MYKQRYWFRHSTGCMQASCTVLQHSCKISIGGQKRQVRKDQGGRCTVQTVYLHSIFYLECLQRTKIVCKSGPLVHNIATAGDNHAMVSG